MTPADILKGARRLLAPSTGWGKGDYVKVVNGKPRYCLRGAIFESYDKLYVREWDAASAREVLNWIDAKDEAERVLQTLLPSIHHRSLIAFNDDAHTHKQDVLDLLDLGIKQLERNK